MQYALAEILRPVNWPAFALVSTRVAGVMLVAPLWSLSAIPGRIRGAMAVAITLALLPASQAADFAIDAPTIIVPMLTELLLGFAIGFSAAVFLYGVTIAAEVLSLQMGLSLGAALGASADFGTPGIGQLKGYFVLAVFASLGGHLAMVSAVAGSLQMIPPGGAVDFASGLSGLIGVGGTVFVTAVQIAAPVMVVLLITNIALAVLNRAVPQLNTMMVAVPVTVGVGLIALGAALPFAVPFVSSWAAGSTDRAVGVIELFTPREAGR